MKNPKQFIESLNKLKKFYWSARLPEAYLVASGKGLGEIAKIDYGAFNVAWSLRGQESLFNGPESLHVQAIQVHQVQRTDNKIVLEGAELSEWLTLLTPGDFVLWVKKHKNNMPPSCYARITVAGYNASKVASL